MSVEFSNAYQEILLDNLISVIKQNFIFQTQIKLSEKNSKDNEELSKNYEILNAEYQKIKNEYSNLEVYKNKAEQNNSAHEEKSRIQSALNEEMKKTTSLKNDLEKFKTELEVKNKEIVELKTLVENLQKTPIKPASTTTSKKVVEEKISSPKIKNNLQKLLDGSSF